MWETIHLQLQLPRRLLNYTYAKEEISCRNHDPLVCHTTCWKCINATVQERHSNSESSHCNSTELTSPVKMSYNLCSPSSCQLGSSLYSQETCCEPIRTQTVVSRPCQTSCYRLRTSTFSSPCQTTFPGSLGFRSSSCSSLSSGSRSCYSAGCGSRGFRRLGYGICGFPSLSCGSGFCQPTYFSSRSCQSSCYRPTCGSGFYRSICWRSKSFCILRSKSLSIYPLFSFSYLPPIFYS